MLSSENVKYISFLLENAAALWITTWERRRRLTLKISLSLLPPVLFFTFHLTDANQNLIIPVLCYRTEKNHDFAMWLGVRVHVGDTPYVGDTLLLLAGCSCLQFLHDCLQYAPEKLEMAREWLVWPHVHPKPINPQNLQVYPLVMNPSPSANTV